MSTTKLDANEATVQDITGGYHLITCGSWQVSVMPDGMISLPNLVRPQDVDDFVGAMTAAKAVALEQIETNEAAQAEQLKALKAADAQRRVSNAVTAREERSARAKAASSARSGGARGARKTESNVTSEE